MRNLKTLSWVFVVATVATLMAACAQNSNSGFGDASPTAPVSPYVIPPGSQVGFFAQNSMMTQYNGNSQGTSLNMANSTNMRTLMRNIMGVCDRDNSNGGLTACSSWFSGFQDVMVLANGSQAGAVKLVFRAFPYQSGYGSYYYNLPSFSQFLLGMLGFNTLNMAAMYNPLVLNATINPVTYPLQPNNPNAPSTGFELRANAPSGATFQGGVNNLIHFRVEQGKLEDAGWDFKVYLNYDPINQLVSTGHASRCQTQNCGVSGF